ncbi:MAG: hypothetical protein LBH95_03230 [Oscillospiraceae bacterium]|jgi:stage IV sporulation protein FB|nr:hypothetical protein [Oscillospiraceae bacterium]
MTVGRVKIRAGFVLLVSILVYLDRGYLLLIVFAAAALHELGHYIPLRLLGGRVTRLELTGGGIGMTFSFYQKRKGVKTRLLNGYAREILAVLGGPAASLGFALLFSLRNGIIKEQAALAGMCLSHGVFNLLPMRGLDGGRVLELASGALGFTHARTALNVTTTLTALLLGGLCGVLALCYRDVSLLLAMIYVLSSALPKPS